MRHSEGLRQLAEGGARPEWLLARGLCAFTTLEGADIPPRKRRGFADMAVARWSPFADTRSHVEWSGDRAMVWAWSSERVLADSDGVRLPAPQRILPESLFRGQPMEEGQELIAMDQGSEGRVWRNGHLAASRWWAQPPALDDWNDFRRGAGLPPATWVPEPLEYPLAASAWGALGARGMGELVTQQRVLLTSIAVALVTAALAAPLVGALALKVSIWQVQDDIAAREQAIAPIITARNAAQTDAAAIDALLRMRPPAGQTGLMAAVVKLIPGRWQLLKWAMPDAEHLELTLKMAAADPRRIVEAWEQSGQFGEVTAEIVRQPDEVLVKARILRAGARL